MLWCCKVACCVVQCAVQCGVFCALLYSVLYYVLYCVFTVCCTVYCGVCLTVLYIVLCGLLYGVSLYGVVSPLSPLPLPFSLCLSPSRSVSHRSLPLLASPRFLHFHLSHISHMFPLSLSLMTFNWFPHQHGQYPLIKWPKNGGGFLAHARSVAVNKVNTLIR